MNCSKCFPETSFTTLEEWKSALCAKHLGRVKARSKMIDAAANAAESSATNNRAIMNEEN